MRGPQKPQGIKLRMTPPVEKACPAPAGKHGTHGTFTQDFLC